MARPIKGRCVHADPAATVYKPRGVPIWMLEEQILGWDELEALRLADLEGLYHEEAAERMGVSRATFGRIVASARRKVADALIHGKTIVFQGGHIASGAVRVFECAGCHGTFEVPFGTGRPEACPHCTCATFHRTECQGGTPPDSGGQRRCRKAFRTRAGRPPRLSPADSEQEPGEESPS